MTVSLRSLCAALGSPGRTSVCRDILGLASGHVQPAPVSTRPVPRISLTRFARLLRGQHFHVRIIVAGVDLLTEDDRNLLDYAIFRLYDIYAVAGIGVGRVTREPRTAAASAGHATVTTSADISATGHDITADGEFVPVVVPANMSVTTVNPDGTVTVTLGRSPEPGPCSPRTGSGMRSSVIDIAGEETGRTLAHEIGHYLGAPHPATADNSLMTQTGSVTGGDPFTATAINVPDRSTMLGHCTIRPGLTGI